MGVIRRAPRSAINASICEDDAPGDIVIAVAREEEEQLESHGTEEPVMLTRQNYYHRRRSLRTRVPAIPSDTTPRRNNAQGSRRTRRYENTLMLLRDSGRDDGDLGEVSIEDLVPVIQSARTFSRFLCETSMMGMWNTFVEGREESSIAQKGHSSSAQDKQKSASKSTDPEVAFHGICRKLRNILKQRHLPLGIVDNLEEQVLEFFQTHPLDKTYECGPLDAYRRGLLHAISQYNNLKSFSIGKKKTEKIVHVQAMEAELVTPSLRLASYIEARVQGERV